MGFWKAHCQSWILTHPGIPSTQVGTGFRGRSKRTPPNLLYSAHIVVATEFIFPGDILLQYCTMTFVLVHSMEERNGGVPIKEMADGTAVAVSSSLYSVAFSERTYVGTDDDDPSSMASSPDIGKDGDGGEDEQGGSRKRRRLLLSGEQGGKRFHLFAVCGGRHFSIYQCDIGQGAVENNTKDEMTSGTENIEKKDQQNDKKTPAREIPSTKSNEIIVIDDGSDVNDDPLVDVSVSKRRLPPPPPLPPPPTALKMAEDRSFRLYQDFESSNKNESFRCLAWASCSTSTGGANNNGLVADASKDYLCVGGKAGNILVMDVEMLKLCAILDGTKRTGILDLKASPSTCMPYQNTLLAASALEEIRIWNLSTFSCVIVFGFRRIGGHVGDVYSVGWHSSGTKLVTGGQDASIKVWSLEPPRLQQALVTTSTNVCSTVFPGWKIKDSRSEGDENNDKIQSPSQFMPFEERFPIFTTANVHHSLKHDNTCMIDCVMFVGDLILSKSTENEIILWKPLLDPKADPPGGIKHSKPDTNKGRELIQIQTDFVRLKYFSYNFQGNDDMLYLKFALDTSSIGLGEMTLAAGNGTGNVFLWKIQPILDGEPKCERIKTVDKKGWSNGDSLIIAPKGGSHAMRSLSFSPDGKTLVGCDANCTVFRWNKKAIS